MEGITLQEHFAMPSRKLCNEELAKEEVLN